MGRSMDFELGEGCETALVACGTGVGGFGPTAET